MCQARVIVFRPSPGPGRTKDQMRIAPRRFTPVCRSRCGAGGAGRGPGAGRFRRGLGSLPLCVALLVQANRNDTSDRGLGSAAESTLSGMGRPCRWALVAREGCGSVERVEIFQMRIVRQSGERPLNQRSYHRSKSAAGQLFQARRYHHVLGTKSHGALAASFQGGPVAPRQANFTTKSADFVFKTKSADFVLQTKSADFVS